jgi:hypothetical protein
MRQFGHLPELYVDAPSEKHNILSTYVHEPLVTGRRVCVLREI